MTVDSAITMADMKKLCLDEASRLDVVKPALLTRDTLQRIRREASVKPAPDLAGELGWELERLRRTARAHGIELINPIPTMPPVRPPPQRVLYRLPVAPRREISAQMTLSEIGAQLAARQRQLLEILAGQQGNDFLTSYAIQERMEAAPTREAIAQIAASLNRRLSKTRWHIESSKAPAVGGYRLAVRI